MAIHTEALRPGTRARAAGALTPEEIVQRMRDEVVRRVGAGAQLQRLGDRSLVDGDRAGRAPADQRRRSRRRRLRPSASRRCASAIASASSCRVAGAACSCSGAATAASSSCSPANRRRARIRSRGARSSGSARPGWCSRSRPSRWCSARVDRMMRDMLAARLSRPSAGERALRSRRRRTRGRSCTIQCVAPGTRTRRRSGTNASRPSSSATGKAMSSSAQITSVGTCDGDGLGRELDLHAPRRRARVGGRSGEAR